MAERDTATTRFTDEERAAMKERAKEMKTTARRSPRDRAAEAERERLITELREALAKVKTLSGLLPICSSCKKIRDDKGYWKQIEVYIAANSQADFSHGLCPECGLEHYPDIFKHQPTGTHS